MPSVKSIQPVHQSRTGGLTAAREGEMQAQVKKGGYKIYSKISGFISLAFQISWEESLSDRKFNNFPVNQRHFWVEIIVC